VLAAVQALVEGAGVQAQLAGVALEAGHVQGCLVVKQQVVVLPELLLVIGALRRLGGLLSVRMRAEREVADGKPDLVAVGLLELVERFVTETLAVRSLVVAEL
jgi:hypothetical protein